MKQHNAILPSIPSVVSVVTCLLDSTLAAGGAAECFEAGEQIWGTQRILTFLLFPKTQLFHKQISPLVVIYNML